MTDYREAARRALKRYFGYDDFRTGQADVVNALLNRRDVMAVLPTGAGKSVCYQLPATVPGTLTLVISPLKALMYDQTRSLSNRGIPAASIDGDTPYETARQIYSSALNRELRLLYVAPERLDNAQFRRFAAHHTIDAVAVDEAHCVLQWGFDFRPSYQRIGEFIASFPGSRRPTVAAFTATATPKQIPQIITNLGLRDPLTVKTGFDRPNIRFDCYRLKSDDRSDWIVDYARKHDDSGIVYCTSKAECERLADRIRKAGVTADYFHADVPKQRQRTIQNAFQNGSVQVICATTAFGMGVDKPDIRWVINDGACAALEEFYQEAGRAGRDGLPARSIMLWTPRDFKFRSDRIAEDVAGIDGTAEEKQHVAHIKRVALASMERYCKAMEYGKCLRGLILAYFGERSAQTQCGNCAFCNPAWDAPRDADAVRQPVHLRHSSVGSSTTAASSPGQRYRMVMSTQEDRLRMKTIAAYFNDLVRGGGTPGYDRERLVHAMLGDWPGEDGPERPDRRLESVDGYGALKDLDEHEVRRLICSLESMRAIRVRRGGMLAPGPYLRQALRGDISQVVAKDEELGSV